MNIVLNQKGISLDGATTLIALLSSQQIKPEGIAIAINNRIIRKEDWPTTELAEGDKITIIQATYGG